jgi:transposase InsO family protein
MVYGHEVGETMEQELVLNSFKKACKTVRRIGKNVSKKILKKILFHQDQGSQYTSYLYVEEALKIGRLSYSMPGTPTDNPGQESFFGRFKDEWKDEIFEIQSFTEVKKFINKKIKYYNNKRLHTSIGYTTPSAYTKSVLKSLP